MRIRELGFRLPPNFLLSLLPALTPHSRKLQTKATQTRIKMMSAMISAPMTARPVAPVAARPQRSSLVVRASGSRQVRDATGTGCCSGFLTVPA